MAYIVQRNTRFYVVAYDGTDPVTSRERRRWHPAGHFSGTTCGGRAISHLLDQPVHPLPTGLPTTVARGTGIYS